MSFPLWALFVGSRALLAYTRDGSTFRPFGHGQRLTNLSVSRSYATVYTISSRELTAIPRGRFRVEWSAEAALSERDVLNLVFGADGGTLRDPVFFTLVAYMATGSGQTAQGRKLTLSDAVVGEMSLSVDTDRPQVQVRLSGIARDFALENYTPGQEPTVTLPSEMFLFSGASLLESGGSLLPVTSAELSVRQGAEGVWGLGGGDRLGAVYLGEYSVQLSVTIPTSTASVTYLRKLLDDDCIAGLTLRLVSCREAVCSSGTTTTLTFTFGSLGKITEFRAPLTEIGVNETSFTVTYNRVTLSVG